MNKGQFDKWLSGLMHEVIEDVERNDGEFTEYELGKYDTLAMVRDKLRSE